MSNIEQKQAEARELVAGLFANGNTPMQMFGIRWEQVEMLERRNPGFVIKAAIDDDKLHACGGYR